MRRALLLSLLLMCFAVPVAEAAFPGANGKIAFTSRIDGPSPDVAGPPQVFTIDADGTDLTQLTFSGLHDDPATFSPDGRLIAFARDNGTARLWLMNADGSNQTRASGVVGPELPTDWSPDGTHVLLSADGAVWSATPDGSHQQVIADSGAHEVAGSHSPDGTRVAFMSTFGTFAGQTFDLYTVRVDGTEDWVRLTNDRFDDLSADWSPEGSRIAFISNRDGDFEVYTMNPDGTGVTQITTNTAHELAVAWSPDGTRLAFTSDRELFGNSKLYVMNADGSGETKISDRIINSSVDWQPLHNRPPDCAMLTADPAVFERADRRLRIVQVAGATDPDGDAVELEGTGVTQDEPVTGLGDHTRPDARLLSGDVLRVRAERSPRGDGRVYRIAVTATDSHGASCTGTATVGVPRHRNRVEVDSAPPSYDSVTSSTTP